MAARHSRFERFFLSATDWELIRHAPQALWLVRHAAQAGDPCNVLAAVDPSHPDEHKKALDRALLQAAAASGDSWEILGSLDRGMEVAVVDLYFTFWQYSPQSQCANVPGPEATNEQVWDWTQGVVPLDGYLDNGLLPYLPYYYQAAYQMGWYQPYESPLAGVLRYPGSFGGQNFLPADLKPVQYDDKAMPNVDRWVRTSASQMLYVYGGNDPWGAERFDCGKNAVKRECSVHTVVGGTHGARISQLPADEQAAAKATLLTWAGLTPADPAAQQIARTGHPKKVARLDVKPDYLTRRGL